MILSGLDPSDPSTILENMKICGVDPGSRCTGYAVISVQGNRCRALDWGVIRTAAGSSLPTRLAHIHSELSALLEKHLPDSVAVEGVFHAVNASSALKLGHTRGVILLAAEQKGLPVHEYSPLKVKQAVVGYGRAEKHQVQLMVKRLLNLEETPEPHDAADALAIALCHAFNRSPDRHIQPR